MAFICPHCTRVGALRIVSRIELPPDSRSDEITLQIVTCAQCGFTGIAVYEESRRGALDSASFSHTGYYAEQNDVASIKRLIDACPTPKNPRCPCPSHRTLGHKNEFGRWDILDDLPDLGTFAMRLR
jgi:hypothetical protein